MVLYHFEQIRKSQSPGDNHKASAIDGVPTHRFDPCKSVSHGRVPGWSEVG